jgi:hypothetical protein
VELDVEHHDVWAQPRGERHRLLAGARPAGGARRFVEQCSHAGAQQRLARGDHHAHVARQRRRRRRTGPLPSVGALGPSRELRVNRFAHRASSCFQRALARSAAGDTKPRSSQRQRLACGAGPRGAPQDRLVGGLRGGLGRVRPAVWQRAVTTPDRRSRLIRTRSIARSVRHRSTPPVRGTAHEPPPRRRREVGKTPGSRGGAGEPADARRGHARGEDRGGRQQPTPPCRPGRNGDQRIAIPCDPLSRRARPATTAMTDHAVGRGGHRSRIAPRAADHTQQASIHATEGAKVIVSAPVYAARRPGSPLLRGRSGWTVAPFGSKRGSYEMLSTSFSIPQIEQNISKSSRFASRS